MTKYEKISVLAKETARSIGENKESWMKYLDVASRLYKYPFEDQILIYAQRPDATACAPLEMWNEKMFCWVNRGAKGIALIDQESDYPRLRYVFDVSDVHKARRIGKSPFIWNIREEHEEGILAALERIYGTTNQDSSFEDRIYQISKRIADDYYEEIVDDLIDVSAGSYLEDLDGDTVSLRLRETLEQSVCYTVLKRCGFDMAEYEGEFPFEYIHEFNTLRTLSVLGSATSELCEPMLIQIGRSIARYERKRQSRESQIQRNKVNKNERMEKENEPDIREERRLPDSESDTRRGEAKHVDQVRNPAEELSEKSQTGDLQRSASERRIDGALSGDSGPGRTEVRQSDGETHEVTGNDRAAEGNQSSGVDKKDEHDLSAGGGSDSSGTGLSVEELESYAPPENSPYRQMDLFSLMSEQLGNIAVAQVEKPNQLSFPGTISDEKVAKILCTGGGLENSRKRIFAKYEQGKTPEEMTDFLRREYGSTGKGFNFGEEQISVWFDENGMSAAHGNSALEHTELKLSWEEIEKIIRSQVESGTYMDSTEAYMVDYYERKRITNQLYFFYRDSIGEFPKGLEISGYNYPGEEEYLMDLLTKPDKIQNIVSCLDETLQKIESEEISIRFRLAKNPYELRDDVADLLKERISYPLAEKMDVLTEDFITSDEIDYVLSSGSGFAQGSFRIYDFYQKDYTVKEAADFLKKEYGTGGSSHALAGSDNSYKDYDAKGISLKKGNIFTPDAEVLLSWNVVAKRIEKLMQEGRYLSDKKKNEYAAYKQEQEKKALEQAKEELSGVDTPDEEESIRSEDTPPRETETKQELPYVPPEEISAENYVITSDELGIGTPKEKFRWNVEAIQTLQKIEAEERMVTAEEQEILARYVGWGGLADAFDETKSAWANEYQELKSILSDEEYVSARESTLNAYYTSPTIIRGIYHTLEKMGFAKGNILEPSMGIGNFFGMLPETMRDSKLYGVELDSLTGRMAKQLYPKANITVDGFEKTGYPNDFFDVVIGNVPFGQYKVLDKKYDKQNFGGTGFLIHDYFFAKAIDQVRPGGIIAFITSKGTMDKENPKVRKYIAQRAELLGAVRLPNTAFKENAGTEVTSDIIFLKKRDRVIDIEPDWVHLSEDDNGIVMNHYFTENPDMIVGSMEMVSGPYGLESTCVADTSLPFEEQLETAFGQISGEYEEIELELSEESTMDEVIPAIPEVKNFSYTLVDEKLYYRENSVMKPVEASEGMIRRIHGMVAIRDCTQELIRLQLEEYPEEDIKAEQKRLNDLYDAFVKENGRIVSKTNKRAFHQDSSYCLLCSLEKLDEEGNFLGKADMFSKRTIKKTEVVTSVDTASEALAVSLSEKAAIDFAYMSELTDKSEEELIEELTGVIFKNPVREIWETADAYLSGNVRDKLQVAGAFAENDATYAINVEALKRVQPRDLDASEIEVRIGATWIEPRFIEDFMREVFETPSHLLERDVIKIQYSEVTGQWNVKGKNADYGNALVNMTYGTNRRNAYQILEDSLNLKDSRVYDTVIEDGKEKRVLNKKETTIVAQKQDAMREAFRDWVFRDQERREVLVNKYNVLFNSTRPREYDGSHLVFPGMTPDIELKDYQKNAVAHVLYGHNTLLAHCVGAGKTFEMVAAAMESKRLGLCQKSLFVVPNHLTEQWASDFLRLYPGANILAATKKDFQPANRKKFCSRIATGDYDAVIIGHTQFESTTCC